MTLPKFKFLHCADLHLGSFFAGLSSQNPEIAQTLADSPFCALANLIDFARTRRSDFVVIAGDVFEDARPGLEIQLKLKELLSKLDIPVLIAGGNHDYRPDDYHDLVEYPANVIWFDRFAVKTLVINGCTVEIAGLSHTRPQETRNLSREFCFEKHGDFTIGLLHANVNGQTDFQPYAPATLADLTAGPADYWALGHVHQFRVLSTRPYIVYPGCLQGCTVNESGPKGFVEVEYFCPDQVQVTFHPAQAIRFEIIECDIKNMTTLDQIFAGVRTEIERRNLGAAIVRILLKGSTTLNGDLRRLAPEELTMMLKDKLCATVESVKLKTTNQFAPDNALAQDILTIFEEPGVLGEPAKTPERFTAGELDEINLEAKMLLLDALGEE